MRVYGLGEIPADGRLRFRPVSDHEFIRDLASCAGLVSTAGNQLIGEAQHLGKPVLAFPEAKNSEQEINAHFLDASGAGMRRPVHELSVTDVWQFLERLPQLRSNIDRRAAAGNAAVKKTLERFLPVPKTVPRASREHRRSLQPVLSHSGA